MRVYKKYIRNKDRSPTGLVAAQYFPDNNQVSVGFSLCAKNDVFNKKLAHTITEGRLESYKYTIQYESDPHDMTYKFMSSYHGSIPDKMIDLFVSDLYFVLMDLSENVEFLKKNQGQTV